MTTKQAHKCRVVDLDKVEEKPLDNGEGLSYLYRCKICGREFEEVYIRADGWWDKEAEDYVSLQP